MNAADFSTPPAPGALAPLRRRWRGLQQRFDARPARERVLMTLVGAALVLALADTLSIEPALAAWKSAHAQRLVAEQAQQRLRADARRIGDQISTQARQRQAELDAWRQRVRDNEQTLRSHEAALVGPDEMLRLLEQMLARHGQVRVRSMRSLDRVDLLVDGALSPAMASAVSAATAATPAAPAAPGTTPRLAPGGDAPAGASPAPSLYRHGVELVLEGGFNELLAYLQALEAMPQHVLWGGLSLKVQQHPSVLMTLRVYTVSRDRHWMEI